MKRPIRNDPKMCRNGSSIAWPRSSSFQRYIEARMPTNLMLAAPQKAEGARVEPLQRVEHQPRGDDPGAVLQLDGMRQQQPEHADRDPQLERVEQPVAPGGGARRETSSATTATPRISTSRDIRAAPVQGGREYGKVTRESRVGSARGRALRRRPAAFHDLLLPGRVLRLGDGTRERASSRSANARSCCGERPVGASGGRPARPLAALPQGLTSGSAPLASRAGSSCGWRA